MQNIDQDQGGVREKKPGIGYGNRRGKSEKLGRKKKTRGRGRRWQEQ